MSTPHTVSPRKRPVNLTLSEDLVQVPYLVSVQSASSDRYRRRLVVPLARISALPPGNQRLGMCWIYSIGPRPNRELEMQAVFKDRRRTMVPSDWSQWTLVEA